MHVNSKSPAINETHVKKESMQMKKAMVLHNPGAGEGDTSRAELLRALRAAGFKCSYSSTKPLRWDVIEAADIDFLVLAGGDGTVRKIAAELLSRTVLDKKLPIGLLPIGTANNIAKTLGLYSNRADIIRGWRTGNVKKFDVGRIQGLSSAAFFLESFGYGLFPRLMHEMKAQKKNDIDDSKMRMRAALELLHYLIVTAPVKKCRLIIDGLDYSGEFLLIEVMNTRSIGPNLTLAPAADPGDAFFDIVLVKEDQRSALAEYVRRKIDGEEEARFELPLVKGENLEITWNGRHVHVDDEYVKLAKPAKITIEIRDGLLEFLLPTSC